MWNPFKKSNSSASGNFATNMMMRIAQKKIEKMSPKERESMMQEAFNPKNKDKLLSAMEMMKKSGQITDEQYEMAKKKLGV
jgi:hypothetical protein